ncbi:MAG TPA: replicative DNA helicase [bacterium]|nr:replicative DNA helicase [bacterium]HRS73115.1 replicative DNA helicase [Patescibacteria group bacterium]HOR69120.1 replicative DNA helicase [bacterium]HPD03503.1 replicative DNA helicase [bacterium]HPL83238.1 replicative DNA helicase [bacterium]
MNKADQTIKMPPQNQEAEISLLGCLLIDKTAIVKVVDIIQPDDFYNDINGLIFGAMLALYQDHQPIDLVNLADKLKTKNQLDTVGGRSYLTSLLQSVATAANVVSYAEIIKHKSTLRRLITAASTIHELGYNEDDDLDQVLDQAEQTLFSVSHQYLKQSFQPISNLLPEAFNRIDELHKQSGRLRGLPTGFIDLDKLLSGLQKSDLVILASRPSVGKTSLAMDLARQTAIKNRAKVGIFSLEMSKEQLVDRLICAEANVSLWKMRTGQLSDREEDDDFGRISYAMGALADSSIYIDDSPNCNVMEIRTKCRRLQSEHGLDLVIIDYLQLMEGRSQRSDNRVQEVAEITRSLKGLARELNVPVVALSQLSRAVEQTKPAIPKLAHLRESGSIEQDADVVMFIYRKAADRNYDIDSLNDFERHVAEIHIAKHRNGPTGKVILYFDENTVNFKNLEKSGSEAE